MASASSSLLAQVRSSTSTLYGTSEVLSQSPSAVKMRKWRAKNLEHSRRYMRGWHAALRREVLDHYGGACACCGETTLEFLSLDHKNGGGTKHRNEIGL